MTTNNNIDALLAYAEFPFGHPGHNFDHSPPMDQNPEPDYSPDKPVPVVHYGPGNRPL